MTGIERPRAAKESSTAHHIETPEERFDVSDPQFQAALIKRFFTRQYPDIPLSDPDARARAAREWVGDPDDKTTRAARFRAYIEKMQKEHTDGFMVETTTAALDNILEEIHALPETLH